MSQRSHAGALWLTKKSLKASFLSSVSYDSTMYDSNGRRSDCQQPWLIRSPITRTSAHSTTTAVPGIRHYYILVRSMLEYSYGRQSKYRIVMSRLSTLGNGTAPGSRVGDELDIIGCILNRYLSCYICCARLLTKPGICADV